MNPITNTHWLTTYDGDPAACALFKRHYSYRRYADNRRRTIFVGPGEKMVLVTPGYDALFVWRKFHSRDNQVGVNCAVFRNESEILSSELIKEACAMAWLRWPGERLYTYVNPRKIKNKDNPGYCFKQAGWRVCGVNWLPG